MGPQNIYSEDSWMDRPSHVKAESLHDSESESAQYFPFLRPIFRQVQLGLSFMTLYGPGLDATGQSYLQRVRSASQKMAKLIDDLLNLSRISRTEIVREPVDLSQLAQEILDEKQMPDRSVETRIEPGLVVQADRGLIRVALWNLLDNAWKYTSKKEKAEIEFFSSGELHERVFTVRDNGEGFDMGFASQLFKPFQRLHTDREFPGSGVGLATAQRVIERHGGEIFAMARRGRGASFSFTLGQPKPSGDGANV